MQVIQIKYLTLDRDVKWLGGVSTAELSKLLEGERVILGRGQVLSLRLHHRGSGFLFGRADGIRTILYGR